MNVVSRDRGLTFPFPEPPAPGAMVEVAPGVMWARIALPFRLDHVNIFFIEDGDGWAVLDTGINNEATRAAWESLVAGLGGRPLTRLITSGLPDGLPSASTSRCSPARPPISAAGTFRYRRARSMPSPTGSSTSAMGLTSRPPRSSARRATAICAW